MQKPGFKNLSSIKIAKFITKTISNNQLKPQL